MKTAVIRSQNTDWYLGLKNNMQTPNVKVYLIVSGILIVLFLMVSFYPFGKKGSNKLQNNLMLTPTSVESNPSINNNFPTPTLVPADFTGVADEGIPQDIVNSSAQKTALKNKLPLDLSTFSVEFDYNEDKFVVNLKDPKDKARTEFENWKNSNYPALNINQFNFR